MPSKDEINLLKQYEKALKQHEKQCRAGLQDRFDAYLLTLDYERSMNVPVEEAVKHYWQRLLNL